MPLERFANRFKGKTGTVIGRGPTLFDFPDLAEADGPVFFINDAVSCEQYVPHDDVFWFALDHPQSHWLRKTRDHEPIRSLPVLMQGNKWGKPGDPRGCKGARRVCWYLPPKGFTDRWDALSQSRGDIATSRMFYRSRGTIQPLLHFAWFTGLARLRLIGCDGIHNPLQIYDPRLPNLSGRDPGMIYDSIRRRQDEVMGRLGIAAEYVGTPRKELKVIHDPEKKLNNAPAKPAVTLITPTRDSPQAFALCERWIEQQDFAGRVQWIVVDDGDEPITCTQGQTYIRRQPRPDDPDHTLGRNLLAAMEHVQAQKVIIIEHDDYYPPGYVAQMVDLLDKAALVGTRNDRYYNVRDGRWQKMGNANHASLFSTAFRRESMSVLAAVCRTHDQYIDKHFWHEWTGQKLLIDREAVDAPQAIGIKCLPGRKSLITLNGRWSANPEHRPGIEDREGEVLRQWIPDDHDTYLAFRQRSFLAK